MSGDLVIQLGQEALMIVLIVSAPMLGLGLSHCSAGNTLRLT